AVKVYRWQPGEFNIGFVDWNPRPADESMGIFRPVWIRYSDAVSMKNPVITSKVDTVELDEAWLTVEATLCNSSDAEVSGKLIGKFDGKKFSYPVTLAAGETRTVKVTSEDAKVLHMKNPRLWWCHNLGTPEMYDMDLSFVINNKVSDSHSIDFGVRQIDSYINEAKGRQFVLNGKKVLIKGAGWTDDIFLRNPDGRNKIEVSYVKHMNLNTIRFENVWGTSQNIYDTCDKLGVFALVGWSCQWEWEVYTGKPNDRYGCVATEEEMDLIAESFEDQVLWLRNHPSIIGWYAASDMLPRPELEQKYLDVLAEIDTTRPYMVHAGSATSPLSGPAGMKMWGPYEWQAPYYWYSEEAKGNATGFNTEIGIGAQFPVKETILKMIPEDQLWPVGEAYDYHTTTSRDALHDLSELKTVIEKRMGGADNLDEFIRKAHFIDYEGTRAMIEAHRVNVPRSTGVIQWMLNSAWPSLYWQMYDWYLVPTSGFWSVRKGCAPQQLIYNYGDNHIYAVNDEKENVKLRANLKAYGLDGQLLCDASANADMPMGSSVKLFEVLPKGEDINDVMFLFLTLTDRKGNIISKNEYVIAEVMDKHDWNKYRWWRTQIESYADFSALDELAPAEVAVSVSKENTEHGAMPCVTLENKSDVVAFFVRMDIKYRDGEILPALWSDNLVTLQPGETLTVNTGAMIINGIDAELVISGWNVAEQVIIL
ncbi:MAG: glycoside hydrolase family 2, partial [Bacteroidaceae bacterium]|nr:glycoside hydrolase family 2 [Bacteroidaceae bacterium]